MHDPLRPAGSRRSTSLPAMLLYALAVAAAAVPGRGPVALAAAPVAASFTNPLLPSGPDPWITRVDDDYYYMHTLGNRIALRKTRDVSKLAEAEEVTVWTPPAAGANAQSIWAPELHRIDGKWYIYYSAAAAGHDDDDHRGVFVLENGSADPLSGRWIDRGRVNTARPGIDGTTFAYGGHRYFVYSPYVGPDSVLRIARMSNPWTVTGEEVTLARPDLSWERQGGRQILEGPEFLIGPRGDLFLTYSASACWSDDYALGLLSAAAGSDPLDASAWTKSPRPVLAKSPENNVYATGHNGFFTSPDGRENWIVYHANTGADQKCTPARSPRIQRFGWTADGRPDFAVPVAAGMPLAPPGGGAAPAPAPPGAPFTPPVDPHRAYLFAHMTKERYGVLHYSVSLDGFNWRSLNRGRPVSADYHGHASIARGPDGRYYLVGNKSDDDPDIRFWVSDDLIRWRPFGSYRPDLSHVEGHPGALQRIGAPKLYWDAPSRRFLLSWHTPNVPGDDADPERYWASQRTLYVTSPDLRRFESAPRRLFAWDMATIDTIIAREADGRYCAIVKDERYPSYEWTTGKTIRLSCAGSLLGPYPPPGPPVSPNFREAPTLIRAPSGRDWLLFYEQYAGTSYGLSMAPTLSGPWYQVSGNTGVKEWNRFEMPAHVRHGSMIAISRREYDALLAAFPAVP